VTIEQLARRVVANLPVDGTCVDAEAALKRACRVHGLRYDHQLTDALAHAIAGRSRPSDTRDQGEDA
jgi:hypothetical protein